MTPTERLRQATQDRSRDASLYSIAQDAGMALTTLKRFLAGHAITLDVGFRLARAVGLRWEDVAMATPFPPATGGNGHVATGNIVATATSEPPTEPPKVATATILPVASYPVARPVKPCPPCPRGANPVAWEREWARKQARQAP